MDRFLKRPTPAVDTSSVNSNPSKKPKPSAKQGDVSAAFRAQEFGRNFYVSGGKMFCKPCNTVVDHTRKSVVTAHVKSKVCAYIVYPFYFVEATVSMATAESRTYYTCFDFIYDLILVLQISVAGNLVRPCFFISIASYSHHLLLLYLP